MENRALKQFKDKKLRYCQIRPQGSKVYETLINNKAMEYTQEMNTANLFV